MEYKGYRITAEVTEASIWSLDENGKLVDKIDDGAVFEVTGYFIHKNDDQEFFTTGETDPDGLRALVDTHIAELAS